MRITPITRRRLHNFKANRRGFWSLWIFLVLFLVSLFAEFIANDRPLLVRYDGQFYVAGLHGLSGNHLRRRVPDPGRLPRSLRRRS